MAAVMFDTLKMSKALGKSFPPEQAMALTEAFSESLVDTIATRADIVDVKADIKAEIADVKAEIADVKADIKAEIVDVKAEIASVKASLMIEIRDVRVEIRDVKVDLVRWIVGAIAFNLLATVGLMLTLIKLTSH